MKSALDVHRELLAADVAHEMLRLRSPIVGADDLPDALGVDAAACVAIRCYRTIGRDGSSRLCAVMVRAGDTPDPAALLDALDAVSVRAATAAEVNQSTDYAAGLVSPLCLPDDVPLLADAALGGAEVLYAATGESGVAVAIRTRDLLVAANARVTTLTARPLAAEERSGWTFGTGMEAPAGRVLTLTGSRQLKRTRSTRRTG
jgi:prolyl-tRNA editing enzyme YbaK/EbsC (Cys-tRNA(Pro) deacylase)